MIRIACLLLLLTLGFNCYAEEITHQTRWWNSGYTSGPLTTDKKYQYYLESGVRFVDKEEKFNLTYYEGAIGKVFSPNLVIWLGSGWETSTSDNEVANTAGIMQQISWTMYSSKQLRLLSRTRLEENYQFSESGLSWLLRQRLKLEIPIGKCDRYYLDMFDEIFLHFNHPDWVSNKAISQNRLAIGFRYLLTPQMAYIIGYINRFTFSDTTEMSNILSLRIEYNL